MQLVDLLRILSSQLPLIHSLSPGLHLFPHNVMESLPATLFSVQLVVWQLVTEYLEQAKS